MLFVLLLASHFSSHSLPTELALTEPQGVLHLHQASLCPCLLLPLKTQASHLTSFGTRAFSKENFGRLLDVGSADTPALAPFLLFMVSLMRTLRLGLLFPLALTEGGLEGRPVGAPLFSTSCSLLSWMHLFWSSSLSSDRTRVCLASCS